MGIISNQKNRCFRNNFKATTRPTAERVPRKTNQKGHEHDGLDLPLNPLGPGNHVPKPAQVCRSHVPTLLLPHPLRPD